MSAVQEAYQSPFEQPTHGLTRTFNETIALHGQEVNMTTEVPFSPTTDQVAYIIPGFGGIKASSDPLRSELARLGVTTVSYSPARKGVTFLSDLLRSQDLHVDTINGITKRLADSSARYSKHTEQRFAFDPYKQLMVPHSMGGLAAANYAAQNPDNISAIVNLAAAGYGSPKLGALASDVPAGIIGGIWHELRPFARTQSADQAKQLLKTVLHYYASNPSRTIGEMYSCLSTDVRPQIAQLGNRVAYLAFKYDILIPPSEEAVSGAVNMYHEFENMGHLGPQVKPNPIARKIIEFASGNAKKPLYAIA